MGTLTDPQLETFAQCLLRNLVNGTPRSKAAEAAGREAGYKGSSLAANARKRANRKDVKARMVELATPRQEAIEAALAIDVEGAKLRLAEIIRADSGLKSVKATDVIAAVRQLSAMEGWEAPKRFEHAGANGSPLFDASKLNDEQLAALEDILAALAPDDTSGEAIPEPEGQLH